MTAPLPRPKQIRALLDRLCVEQGFCLPPAHAHRLVESPPADVEAFTDAVFRAEGLDPRTADRALYRDVRNTIAEALSQAMGGDEEPA